MSALAITVKSPWAWAIATGAKTVENRPVAVTYRGPLLIHSGRSWCRAGARDPRVRAAFAEWMTDRQAARPIDPAEHTEFAFGAIVAVVDLVDVHAADGDCCTPWGDADYPSGRGPKPARHWVLTNARRLAEPVPARGMLGLWRPSGAVLDAVREQVDVEAVAR